MKHLPQEILIEVASNLESDLTDLQSFRLVCRRWACAGYLILRRHLSVLNISRSLNELQHFINQDLLTAAYTKELSIYHGSWSPITRTNWELHPLLFGKDRFAVQHRFNRSAEIAYNKYRDFINRERQITSEEYEQVIQTLLSSLINARSLTIGHLSRFGWRRTRKSQYTKLIDEIWLLPKLDYNIEEAIATFLPILSNFPTMNKLHLEGWFTKCPLNSSDSESCQ